MRCVVKISWLAVLALLGAEEALARVLHDQGDVIVVAEQVLDLRAFVGAHQASIDVDAGELVADSFVKQQGGDG